MAKHHKAEKNELLELIPGTEAFIGLFIKNSEDREQALNELLTGGPRHKQVYAALLAQRTAALLRAIQKSTGNKFTLQKGELLTSHKEEMEVHIPLVLASVKKADHEELAEALSHAPAHEIILFNALLQAIEWSISELKKESSED